MTSCLLHLSPATAACPRCGAALCAACAAGGHRCLTRGVEPVGERERLLAAALHLCALLNFALPLIGAAGAMVALWWAGGSTPYLNGHLREALGFQLLYVAGLLGIVAALGGWLFCLPLAPLLALVAVGCSLTAARRAWQGAPYSYPLTGWLLRV